MAHIEVIAEYNENGAMLWADAYPGAYSRGETVSAALEKFPKALSEYAAWAHGAPLPNRDNIILTRDPMFSADNAIVCHDLGELAHAISDA